ncbi:MAG TPA: 50S ribosomal protein L32 [Candidatus Ratteibacteria bacterium]|nr:50S ribosomal protein L32 [bacterium]HRR95173.1 50S ribosomal protein L32 [Candidatus Ratteibacteria bacterium]
MPNPKRKHSKSRTGKRRNSKKIKNVSLSKCPNCGSLITPHSVCPQCGYYKGELVIQKKEKRKKQ